MSQTYDSDVHWMLKLAANEDARLKNELEEIRQLANDFKENNKRLSIQIISLEQQLDNALQLSNQLKDKIAEYETGSIIHSQLAKAIPSESETTIRLLNKTDTEQKHKVIMQLTRRALTSEQAQHAYNMVVMGNARITDMAKKFNCNGGTIANIISGISYKEIVRKD